MIYHGWQTLHYLANFLVILEHKSNHLVREFEVFFTILCSELGITINIFKNQQGTLVDFLGIVLDIKKMEAWLPQDKLGKAIAWVEKIWDAQSIARSELKSLVGFLFFEAKVVVPGRAFLWRLFDALAKLQSYYHLDVEMRANLNWWKEFLTQ